MPAAGLPAGDSVCLTVSADLPAAGRSEAGCATRCSAFLDPLEGGADGRGWPFGGAVRPSALVGVRAGARWDRRRASPSCRSPWTTARPPTARTCVIGTRELVWLADLQVTWVGAVPTGGGLR